MPASLLLLSSSILLLLSFLSSSILLRRSGYSLTHSLINLSHSSSSSLGHGSSRSTCTTLLSFAAARVPLVVTSSLLASDAEKQSVPCGASVALPAKAAVQVLDEAMGDPREIGEREVRSFGTSAAACV